MYVVCLAEMPRFVRDLKPREVYLANLGSHQVPTG